ncbi:MoaD/ThiS family protein [Zooshikella harenae]|uniref:MoaD/ThiS family protein n=1 Tax=Zooshikella harenae TaxID=2827238 RepID=A0ABS5ZF10_9GAMM|nr:MoaD/ThiS family protein [Zooshikella harenae]MBU2712338.1 MoaD/ThiS family protein [Zooshikella harenae]
MKLTVFLQGQLRLLVGKDQVVLSLTKPSLSTALQMLCERSFGHRLLAKDGSISPSILFFLGDQQIKATDEVFFAEGDTLTLLSPISGG